MNENPMPRSRDEANALDAKDPLKAAREQFVLPEDQIYLVGHSLGPSSHKALSALKTAAEIEWADGLVGAWNTAGWFDLPRTVGRKIATLIGVGSNDVIMCDSVSVNLFKLAGAALPLTQNNPVIFYEDDEFPTDQYIAQGLSSLTNVASECLPSGDGIKHIKQGGVLIKSAVNYRTAQIVDIQAHEEAAKENGGIIIWDLSHASGVITLDLAGKGARLATGCTYKYLNGGPGAPAFIYADPVFADKLRPPLSGWFGHKAPFDFDGEYAPTHGAARFAVGTPPILSLSALNGALEVFEGIDLTALQSKTQSLVGLCNALAAELGLPSLSPTDGDSSGGHVSLLHDDAYPIVRNLIARGVMCDFRAPTTMRFGFSPLFIRYVDVWDAMAILKDILDSESWDQDVYKIRSKVT